jgi:hypothetical protein
MSPNRPELVVVVKSHRPMEYLRMGLLETTLRSVAHAFPNSLRLLLLNDASDGSAEAQIQLASEIGFTFMQRGGVEGETSTPGCGAKHVFDWFVEDAKRRRFSTEDVVLVTSDDDILWRPDAEERLRDEWSVVLLHEPTILCGLLEPEWAHNTPRRSIDGAHGRLLVRDSVPGAAWSVAAHHARTVRDVLRPSFGYDSIACAALRAAGHAVAAIDLCEHIGEDASTHDNQPNRDLRGKPIDKTKWGLR